MSKPKLNSITSVGFIVREANPADIFITMKDGNLIHRMFQWTLCPFGGNWVGDAAKNDVAPIDTFRRKFSSDFATKFQMRDFSEELALGFLKESDVEPVDKRGISRDQGTMFVDVRKAILNKVKPWKDYLVPIGRNFLNLAPRNQHDGFLSLVSYSVAELNEEEWASLMELQKVFGNLSRRDVSWITSLEEVISRQFHFAYGHETAMKGFWLEMGYPAARNLPSFPHLTNKPLGAPRSSYREYLDEYDVLCHPHQEPAFS